MRSKSPTSALLALTLTFCAGHAAAQATPSSPADPVNAIAGDESWIARYGRPPTPREDALEPERIRTHLAWIEGVLRARDVSHLDEARRARRERLLDALAAYRDKGAFPRNERFSGRRPRFIDDRGRTCAVGHLIEVDAGRALAEAIDARFEYEYLLEMRDAALAAWVASSGFTARELATIQPSYHFRDPEPVRPVEPPPPPPMSAHELTVTLFGADALVQGCAAGEDLSRARVIVHHSPDRGLRVRTTTSPRRRSIERCITRAIEGAIVRAGRSLPLRPLATARTYTLRAPRAPRAAVVHAARRLLDASLASMQRCMPPETPHRRGDVRLGVSVRPDGRLTLVRARLPRISAPLGLLAGGVSDAQTLACLSAVISELALEAPLPARGASPIVVTHRLPYGGTRTVLDSIGAQGGVEGGVESGAGSAFGLRSDG